MVKILVKYYCNICVLGPKILLLTMLYVLISNDIHIMNDGKILVAEIFSWYVEES